LIEHFGGASDQQIRKARRRARIDQRRPPLFFETLGEGKLFCFERIARQVGAEIDVVSPQTQGRAHHDLIKDRRRSVDDEIAAARDAHDAEKIPRIDFGDGDGAAFAEKATSPLGVAIAAPNCVPLSLEELCEERAGRAGAQNEDLHDVAKTVSQTFGESGGGRSGMCLNCSRI